jgi:hypothetical protein
MEKTNYSDSVASTLRRHTHRLLFAAGMVLGGASYHLGDAEIRTFLTKNFAEAELNVRRIGFNAHLFYDNTTGGPRVGGGECKTNVGCALFDKPIMRPGRLTVFTADPHFRRVDLKIP